MLSNMYHNLIGGLTYEPLFFTARRDGITRLILLKESLLLSFPQEIDVRCFIGNFLLELLGFLTNEVRKKTQQIRHL